MCQSQDQMHGPFGDRGSLPAVIYYSLGEALYNIVAEISQVSSSEKQCFVHDRPTRKRTRTSKPTYVPSPPSPEVPFPCVTDLLFRRVAQLEQKLDGIVTLLTSNQSTSQQISLGKVSGVPLPRSPISLNSNASTAGPSTATPPSTEMDGKTATVQTTDSSTSSSELVRVATDRTLSVEPNEQKAEIMLLEFMVNMTEQFPFVVIPTDSTLAKPST